MATKITQLDLFRDEETLKKEIEQEEFKKNVTKSIRGLFARYNELEATFLDMQSRMDRLTEHCFKSG